MKDFLSFRRMITPVLIQVVFFVGAIVCIILGIDLLARDKPIGLLVLFGGPLFVRLWCEFVILFFRMNETLTDIRKDLKQSHPRVSTFQASTISDPESYTNVPSTRVRASSALPSRGQDLYAEIQRSDLDGTPRFEAVLVGDGNGRIIAFEEYTYSRADPDSESERNYALRSLIIKLANSGWERLPDQTSSGLPRFRHPPT